MKIDFSHFYALYNQILYRFIKNKHMNGIDKKTTKNKKRKSNYIRIK